MQAHGTLKRIAHGLRLRVQGTSSFLSAMLVLLTTTWPFGLSHRSHHRGGGVPKSPCKYRAAWAGSNTSVKGHFGATRLSLRR